MTEQSYEEKVSEQLAKQYREEGEAVDKAVEESRDDVEEYYTNQRLEHEQRERELRAYQLGVGPQPGVVDPDAPVEAEVQEADAAEARAQADAEREAEEANAPAEETQEEQNDQSNDANDASVANAAGEQPAETDQGQPTSGPALAETAAGPIEEVAAERQSEANAEETAAQGEHTDHLNADEVVDKIRAADSVEAVDALAEGDDRKTVNDAADRRKKQLEEESSG